MKGFIIYSSCTEINNQTHVNLFGKLENGQSFLTISKVNPCFYLKTKEVSQIKKFLPTKSSRKTNMKNFAGEPLSILEFQNSSELNATYKQIHKYTELYEADLKPQIKFIIDNDFFSSINIDGTYTFSEKIDRIYKNPKIVKTEFKPKLKIVSVDIETGLTGELYCIGLSSKDYRKCFMITNHKLKETVVCKNEEDCLIKFQEEINKFDPDIITGWNIIDFDFVFLKNKFNHYRIPFNLGRAEQPSRLRIEKGFFRSSSINIEGRQVLDGLNLIKDPFIKEAPSIKHAEFNGLSLESISQALLKRGKLLQGKDRHKQIIKLFTTNSKLSHQRLVDYNLRDCELVYDILDTTKTIELAIERSSLTGLTFDKLSASIASFDSLYIREAHKKGIISPTNHYKKKEERITGGYVQSNNPGIYKNVLVFDFKSLYPSIIRTFNIDPASFLNKKEKDSIESPNKAYFKNQDGILPQIIHRLHQAREKAKKEKRELSNHAIKIMMNSFFGVLASPNCRYFNLKMANAITHFGQFLIKLTAEEIKKLGYKIIYSDTDSVFIETALSKTKADNLGIKIESNINKFYNNYIRKKYHRKSFLELEFEKQYLSLMIPEARGKEKSAAKKRYAGLRILNSKETLEITGLEAIRGDWTDAAKDFQKALLIKLFHKEKVERFIRNYIKEILSGKMDKKLIYKKSIRKSLSEYTKITPPHVKAARKLPKLDSKIILYYITVCGPEPIQMLKHKIDYNHYIEKQIKPIANQILILINKDFKEIQEKSKQTKLF